MSEIVRKPEMPTQVPTQMATTSSCLDRRTEHSIHVFSVQSKEAINEHLQALENEWSTERSLEAAASVLALIGILLGAFLSPWCLILPAAISICFLLHATNRFCPPWSLKSGMRAKSQIDTEIYAMRMLRDGNASNSKDGDSSVLAERTIEATKAYAAAA